MILEAFVGEGAMQRARRTQPPWSLRAEDGRTATLSETFRRLSSSNRLPRVFHWSLEPVRTLSFLALAAASRRVLRCASLRALTPERSSCEEPPAVVTGALPGWGRFAVLANVSPHDPLLDLRRQATCAAMILGKAQ